MDNVHWDEYPQEETVWSIVWKEIKNIVAYTVLFVLSIGVPVLIVLLLGTILEMIK